MVVEGARVKRRCPAWRIEWKRDSTAEHEQGEDFIQKKIGFQHVHAVGSKEYLNRLEYQEGDLQASMAW